jgi:HAD superfamily hydrolase (TIGR01509 family)
MAARAFFFDLDGTLVDSERENAESIARVLERRGRPLTAGEREYVVGHGWREIYAHLAQAGGVDLSFEVLKEAAAEEKERMCEAEGLRTLPGAVAFVRAAAARGPCAVVSGSTRREIGWCLRKLSLEDALPWYVGAEDVPRGKPFPDGYLRAAERAGIEAAACLVFEDSTAGIRAAKAAGMRCVALAAGNFLGQDQSAADLRVESFARLAERPWEEWC